MPCRYEREWRKALLVEEAMRERTILSYEKYLFFSYVPRPAEADLGWLNCDFDCDFGNGNLDEDWWVQEGTKALRQTMAEQVAGSDAHALHVIPLSGGLDSRAILGGLLENLPASQIVAATYGIPGAWDFEIPKRITRKYGIRHEIFDLSHETWEIDPLLQAAERLKHPVSVHQAYVRQKITNHFGKECVYWSGFIGDALGGSYLPIVPNTDKREAVRRMVSTGPTPHYEGEEFKESIVDEILRDCAWDRIANRKFSLDQQIDIGVRQNFLHRPLVITEGFHFKTPFLTSTWANFMVNVPYQWLLGFHLYIRIIMKAYKELASLPCTTKAGLPVGTGPNMVHLGTLIGRIQPYLRKRDPYRSHPRTNYINFTEALRHQSHFQDSVLITLQALKKRKLFDDKKLDQWWLDHLHKKANYSKLLLNLSSLELLLQAGRI
jgi:hypothetical protein